MSSNRHGAPFISYSEVPSLNNRLVIVISARLSGMISSSLANVSETSALGSGGRVAVPAKTTSSILSVRSDVVAWVPMTHASASRMFDLPDPLGPTTTLTPDENSSRVRSANDLNPLSVRCLSFTVLEDTRLNYTCVTMNKNDARRTTRDTRLSRTRFEGFACGFNCC